VRETVIRVCLGLLGLVGLEVGLWASLWPRGFYDRFPGGGRVWVAADGPYNEHLVRDFGALNLALTAVVAVALVTRAPAAVRAAGLAWLVYSVPHLVYHLRHLDLYESTDKVLNLVGLGGAVVASAVVVGLSFRPTPPGPTASPPGGGSP
jgi:hypothetical protein